MKKYVLLVLVFAVCCAPALADTSHASLIQVKRYHHHGQRHHAHKAGKHKMSKHHYRSV